MTADDIAPTRAELLEQAAEYVDTVRLLEPVTIDYLLRLLLDAHLAGMVAGQRRALEAVRKAVGMAPLPAPGSEALQ